MGEESIAPMSFTNGRPKGVTLDTGALLALERSNGKMRALLRLASENNLPVAIPATVLAQAWLGGPKQAQIAQLLKWKDVSIPALDEFTARAIGVVCGRVNHRDIVDVHVALYAREHGHVLVTSDPSDMWRIDPKLDLIVI